MDSEKNKGKTPEAGPSGANAGNQSGCSPLPTAPGEFRAAAWCVDSFHPWAGRLHVFSLPVRPGPAVAQQGLDLGSWAREAFSWEPSPLRAASATRIPREGPSVAES